MERSALSFFAIAAAINTRPGEVLRAFSLSLVQYANPAAFELRWPVQLRFPLSSFHRLTSVAFPGGYVTIVPPLVSCLGYLVLAPALRHLVALVFCRMITRKPFKWLTRP
jgi:hypothetical protein